MVSIKKWISFFFRSNERNRKLIIILIKFGPGNEGLNVVRKLFCDYFPTDFRLFLLLVVVVVIVETSSFRLYFFLSFFAGRNTISRVVFEKQLLVKTETILRQKAVRCLLRNFEMSLEKCDRKMTETGKNWVCSLKQKRPSVGRLESKVTIRRLLAFRSPGATYIRITSVVAKMVHRFRSKDPKVVFAWKVMGSNVSYL